MSEKLDSKTLADVQPGGRVRLGGKIEPLDSELLWWLMDAASTLSEGGNESHAEHLRALHAALSAQPSPGGQGDAVVRAINSKDLYQVLMDVQNGIDSPALAGMANGAIRLIDKARAELAARQPVGEPVCNVEGTWLWSKLMDWCKRMGAAPSNHDELFAIANEANALYTAPPAQAVDLGQLPRAVELLSNVSRTLVDWAADEQREAIGIVKALIYSQA